ncbi:polyketide synthase [Gloeophyllum trabeum ATCC 11539]|uniref:Polyketide synthase n=1 Tax=Gloeophyllum trabeum (strain ATCC 11539 / FP-39264 / Madison 617) TaxID=670483 RepID=S7R7E3_GLOTA|nr:polyketide synthase [Gloeophyllum trabeum ATCC 11539]EPQ50300.1 polyketide synthase [Gloeophyllum trabeum ATCC 11539]
MVSQVAPSYSNPDVRALAVVGMSICAPGGEESPRGLDVDAFQEFLATRGDPMIVVPKDRWNAEAFHGSQPGKLVTTKGGFIPEISYGDLSEFGVTPAEAAQVGTPQLVLLHQAFNALQRSGVDYRHTSTGVYIGVGGSGVPYEMDITRAGAYYSTGMAMSIAANRINYVFDLMGPSVPVDTACSSSLVAIHLAIQAIRNGECEQAVIAGVNFVSNPLDTVALSQLGLLSEDGHCKSFSDDADGCARADVVNAVVIKRHDLAVRDHDKILASLVGTSLTTCGNIMGSLTTPNPEAHIMAIRAAYDDAGLQPHQVDFLELHGTGTPVGDMLETNAAGATFSEGRNGRELIIGSVKSNVGHTETGSYLTALVKVIMMLQAKQILPNGYFKTPSKKIHFDEYKLRVPTAPEEFKAHDKELGRIVSISNFGYGGAGGHTVIREHEERKPLPDLEALRKGPFLFTMGALSPRALQTLVSTYKEQYQNVDPLALAEHLGKRTRQMPWRTFAVADSLAAASFPEAVMVDKLPSPVVFTFSGQGPQHWNQGRLLFQTYSVFRESILACDDVHQEYTGRSFLEDTGLFINGKSSELEKSLVWPALTISVAITFFQVAMTDLLTSLNILPKAVVGHSIGETAVLYASGAMPKSVVVKVAIARGKALLLVDNIGGAMVAISGTDNNSLQDYVEAVSALAQDQGKDAKHLYLATFNSPTDIGVSGSDALVDMLANYINTWADGATARKLRVSTAVHSPFVDICEKSYRAELKSIFSKHKGPFVPKVPTMSTVTGEFVDGEYTIDYLWKNLRQAVLFSTAIPKLIERFGENTVFLEVSPHPVLSSYIEQMGASSAFACSIRPPSARQIASGAKNTNELQAFLQAVGRLLVSGVNSINFSVLNGCPSETITGPAYPFQWKHTPVAPRLPSYLSCLLPPTRLLNSSRLRVSPKLPEEWMGDHIVDETNLVPASAYIEMALEFDGVTQVWDCRFDAPCILDENASPATLEVAKDGNRFTIKSSSSLESMQGDLEWTRSGPVFDTLHATGKLGYGKPVTGPNAVTKIDVQDVLSRCFARYTKEEIYAEMHDILQFGPEFSRVERAALNEDEVVCWIRGHVEGVNAKDYAFHPAIMDAAFQSGNVFNLLYDKIPTGRDGRVLYLPYTLRRGYRNDGSTGPLVLPAEFKTYTKLAEWTTDHFTLDIYVLGENDEVVYTFEGKFPEFQPTLTLTQHCHAGLQLNFLNKDTVWPTERYMNYWQPTALPPSRFEGVNDTLDTRVDASEAIQLLKMLDYRAMKSTAQTLKDVPGNFSPDAYDRQRYLAWAKIQAGRFPTVPPVGSDEAIEERYADLFELVDRIAPVQKDILRTSTAAVEVMFRDNIMSKIYELPPFVGDVFGEVATKFVELVKNAVAAGKKVVRVLEVGAGTGRLTALLGQALIDARIQDLCYVDYVSTDISISLAQESTVKSPWPTMTPKALDLSVPLAQQGFDANTFDIVTAFDVLHAIPDIGSTLAALKELLVPGGHIAIIELDGRRFAQEAPGTIYMDYVFGSFAEWFGVLQHRENGSHCSLTPEQWKVALTDAGFGDNLFLSSPGSQIIHMAFVSQGPKTVYTGAYVPPTPNAYTLRGYKAGEEIDLVNFVSTLDSQKPHTLWLYADTDNIKLLGIARSIRQEFGLWKIMLVIFDPSWSTEQRERFIQEKLVMLPYLDSEVQVDADGNLKVPRVIKAPSPPQTEPAQSKPLAFDGKTVWRAYPQPVGAHDVEVAVDYVNVRPLFSDVTEFTGVVTAVGSDTSDGALVGKRVVGIAYKPPSTVIVCPRGQVSPVEGEATSSLAVGPRAAFISSIVQPLVSSITAGDSHVLVHVGSGGPAALAVVKYLQSLKAKVFVTASDPSTLVLAGISTPAVRSTEYDVWVTASQAWAPHGIEIAFNFDNDRNIVAETRELLSKTGTLVDATGRFPVGLKNSQRYIAVDSTSVINASRLIPEGLSSLSKEALEALSPKVAVFTLPQLGDATHATAAEDTAVLLDVKSETDSLSVTRAGVLKGTNAFDPRATYIVVGGSLKPGKLVYQKKILQSLRSVPGVTIDIVANDIMDLEQAKALFSGERRVAGVFFLPVVLEDTLFANMTSEKYWKPVTDVKVKGLTNLVQAKNPAELDFLVIASTAAILLGSEGQANYTSANVQMEQLAAKLPNTVTISVPALTDGGVYVNSIAKNQSRNAALDKFRDLGYSTLRVAEHCVDAIWTLNTPAYNPLYIPPLVWRGVMDVVPPDNRPFVRHLLVKESSENRAADGAKESSIRGTCASVLSMEVDELEDIVPLASYGLDSLTSVRLSGLLQQKFGIAVTQMQLLSSHMTVKKLEEMQEEQNAVASPAAAVNGQVNGDGGAALGDDVSQTVVKLNGVADGTPLFVLHGAGGGISVMRKFAQKVKCPVYGVQDTPEAPINGTIYTLAQFYTAKIREKQPHGPYHLAGFSFGTYVVLYVAMELRDAGEVVAPLIMIDSAPTLFIREEFRAWSSKNLLDNKLKEEIMGVVTDMSTSGSLDDTEEVIGQFEEHFKKKERGEAGAKWVARFCRAYAAHFIMSIRASKDLAEEMKKPWPSERTVLIRAQGGVATKPQFKGASRALGLDKWAAHVDVHELPGTHFGILNPDNGIADVLNGVCGV